MVDYYLDWGVVAAMFKDPECGGDAFDIYLPDDEMTPYDDLKS